LGKSKGIKFSNAGLEGGGLVREQDRRGDKNDFSAKERLEGRGQKAEKEMATEIILTCKKGRGSRGAAEGSGADRNTGGGI